MENNNIVQILSILKNLYGTRPWNWHTRQKPFFVLIATILSQRTRDPQTDAAAKLLLTRYPSPKALAKASQEEIERLIKNVNYYKTKASRIKEVSRALCNNFNNEVPDRFEDLVKLPGVGSKTANCVLLYGFHQAVIPVDTHVHRISNRLGWVKTATPEETEKVLNSIIPSEWVFYVNDLMVKHGQTTCFPKNPKCSICPVNALCKQWHNQSNT